MTPTHSPELTSILEGLDSFGIEDTENLITVETNNKKVNMLLSNYCTDAELSALEAVQDKSGYGWVQSLKTEILARSISMIDGVRINDSMIVTHPVRTDKEGERLVMPVRTVLRDVLATWGQEVLNILWKALMVHRQKIEDRIITQFPETTLFTDVEKRLMDRWMSEIEEFNKTIYDDIAGSPEGDKVDDAGEQK